ncbi:hypothetical protein T4C_706 [Trichinella pseudospiralis]|uniref:Uncharacterized protein n=1 Tax=Trichinella pseudospiralis TaxID=6337 RepID=A0A0V1I1R5_TRIPS|nr:hypothetical protein T4C_706 [Trichinella pseudospiralis]
MDAMMDAVRSVGRLFNEYILCYFGGGCMMSDGHICGDVDD